MIGEDERRLLITVARRSIEAAVRGESFTPEIPKSGPLGDTRGAFVTITEDGTLRGCIGRVVSNQPLVEVVAEMAAAAAMGDPRFHPLGDEELEKIEIEISALTPLRPVSGPDEIEIGRDGLLIKEGARSGLLLPQVATDHGWDALRFLSETCRKAGLSAGSWQDSASIEAFEAEVWSE